MEIHRYYIRLIFIFILFFQLFGRCHNIERRILINQGFSKCADDEKNPIHFNGTVRNITTNVCRLDGDVIFDEFIAGPLEVCKPRTFWNEQNAQILLILYFQFQLIGKRCNIERTQCENFGTFVIRDACKVLDQKNQYWSDLIAHTRPRAKCPFQATTIKIMNATFDFSKLVHFPMDGYTWVVNYKIFKSIPNVRYKKRLLFCMISEATVIQGQQVRNKNKG